MGDHDDLLTDFVMDNYFPHNENDDNKFRVKNVKPKAAGIFLWRQKKVTARLVGVMTAVWVLCEWLQYHLLSLVCHLLLLGLGLIFLWSRSASFLHKSPPPIPEVVLPEDIVLEISATLSVEINRALSFLRETALGKDLKKFIGVISGLWIISVLGSFCSFLTSAFIASILLHTVPILYEKYEDQVDGFSEKAQAEIKKQYAVFQAKVLRKTPIGPLKGKVA